MSEMRNTYQKFHATIPDEEFEQIVLEKVRLECKRIFDGNALQNMDIRSYADYIANTTLIQFETFVLGEKVNSKTETVSFYIPATWFDHLKQDLKRKFKFLKWLKVEVIAEHQSVTLEQIECYPKIEKVLQPYELEAKFTYFNAIPKFKEMYRINQ